MAEAASFPGVDIASVLVRGLAWLGVLSVVHTVDGAVNKQRIRGLPSVASALPSVVMGNRRGDGRAGVLPLRSCNI